MNTYHVVSLVAHNMESLDAHDSELLSVQDVELLVTPEDVEKQEAQDVELSEDDIDVSVNGKAVPTKAEPLDGVLVKDVKMFTDDISKVGDFAKSLKDSIAKSMVASLFLVARELASKVQIFKMNAIDLSGILEKPYNVANVVDEGNEKEPEVIDKHIQKDDRGKAKEVKFDND
jgi:hypothetical protein